MVHAPTRVEPREVGVVYLRDFREAEMAARHVLAVSFTVFAVGFCVVLGGCATTDVTDGYPNQRALLKKTRAQLLACAGPPLREITQDGATILTYYRHAPTLERSTVASKGSVPVPHYACWATVLLEGDTVADVRYQSVPAGTNAQDQCETLFDPCS